LQRIHSILPQIRS